MRRLAAALLLLLLGAVTAHAAQSACGGTDLLAKMASDQPAAYGEVMRAAAAIPNGEAEFWKIERPGVAPSFLLGTAHVTDPRVTALPPGAADALNHASAVALELAELRDTRELMAATLRNASLLVLPPGKSLWDLIPDADETAVRNNPNLPPGTAAAISGYQPWMVAAMISVPACESARKQRGLPTLDTAIAAAATRRGIPLTGLETVTEQLSVFAAMDLDLQARYLVAVAKLGAATTDYFETLVSLYLKRQVTAYLPFATRTEVMAPGDEQLVAFVDQELLLKRNHRMANRAAALLAKGNAFIAVGALHLPGKEGLVELIRQAGYKVTPIN